MSDYKQRRDYEAECKAQGWSWSLLQGTGQPKVDNWWHRDCWNSDGTQVTFPRGRKVPNQPNHDDSNLRRARKGLLPYPPEDTCLCRGCREARAVQVEEAPSTQDIIRDIGKPAEQVPHRRRIPKDYVTCTEAGCDWRSKSPGTRAQRNQWLGYHLKIHRAKYESLVAV